MAVGGLEEAFSSTGWTSGDARPAERSPRSPTRGALQAHGQISFGIPAAESNIGLLSRRPVLLNAGLIC